nr:MAG TPA: hypothetical protein [Caudoviricetes sp.]
MQTTRRSGNSGAGGHLSRPRRSRRLRASYVSTPACSDHATLTLAAHRQPARPAQEPVSFHCSAMRPRPRACGVFHANVLPPAPAMARQHPW